MWSRAAGESSAASASREGCADRLPSVSEACMASLAIIANPNAHRNRLWPLAARELRKAAPGVSILETRGPDELARAGAQLARERPRGGAIAGGDGTGQHRRTGLDP